MGLEAMLRHTVTIERATSGARDEYGQPARTYAAQATVKASIQPKSAREQNLASQGGAVIGDHTIYLLPTDVAPADRLYHDAAVCPESPDLPSGRFELENVRDAAGVGHHYECDASLVTA